MINAIVRYVKTFIIPKNLAIIMNSNYPPIRQTSSASLSEDNINKMQNMDVQDDNNNSDETITIDKTPYTKVVEGKADVLFPSSHDVFYNPVQEFNRDLSVAVIKHFLATIPSTVKGVYPKLLKRCGTNKLEIRVLEALAASGLRSIRYAKEVPGLKRITANDRSLQAYKNILLNVKHNKVEDTVQAENSDATLLMYSNKATYDIIDIDPYGTASPFLDAAVQSVKDGGLLMVTCTDMAVLCGNGIEACHAKYGAVSAKSACCHEMALRIVLQCIESHANRNGRYIEPLISLSVDFYVRLFVRIYSGPIFVKQSICKLSMVYICQGCTSHYFQPLGSEQVSQNGRKFVPGIGPPVDRNCEICGHKFKVCGPIWTSNLHDKDFVRGLVNSLAEEEEFKTSKRMLGMLNVIAEELDDCPLYHRIDKLCSIVHSPSPTVVQFRSALLNSGYRVSMSHCLPTSIKSDAPQSVIWDIVREWAKSHGGKQTNEESLSKTIMEKESRISVSFEERVDANPESRTSGLLRFQINPERFWGPKCRSQTSIFSEKEKEKQLRSQGKRRKKTGLSEQNEHFKKSKVLSTFQC